MYVWHCEHQALYQETAMKEFDNKLTLERKEKHFRDAALKEKHEQFKYEKKAYLNKLKEVHMYVCMYVCICVSMSISLIVYVCMYVCMYV